MPFSLSRERDGAGDSGNMSLAITPKADMNHVYEDNARPQVGVVMRVGSLSARTYSAQDWWQTTRITEIIEEWNEDVVLENGAHHMVECVRFKTGNSTYVWKNF
jgi:hypothetical protein